MGPPGGGRTDITERVTHHFFWVNFTDFSYKALKKIFNTILEIGF